MKKAATVLLLLFAAVTCAPLNNYDTVVYGATPAGICAAISVAEAGYTVALLEPTLNLGGMVVAGGIGLRDIGNTETFKGIGLRWSMLNSQHYGVSYPVYQPDTYVGLASFKKLLSLYPNITIFYNALLFPSNPVTKVGTQIQSIRTSTAKSITEWTADVFIDASYEGDLARFAKVSYTYGRESSEEYKESYAGVLSKYTSWGNFLQADPVNATDDNGHVLPYINPGPMAAHGSADDKMMGYSYRLCITPNVTNQAPFPSPPNYNPDDFVLLQRYIDSLVKSGKYPNGPPFSFLVDVLNYRNYPGSKFDLCDSQSAFTSDAANLNAGYVEGSYAEREEIEKRHYYYLAGLLTYISTDPKVPEFTRQSTLKYGLCKDQWPENNHWPTQMYVREGLRIVGDKVMTQNDLVGGRCTNNSVGLGSWFIDIHVVQRVAVNSSSGDLIANNEGQLATGISGKGGVYELPYTLLLPKKAEATNLLVPVCHSATHVAYASLRVEPHFMQLGHASGAAAALSIKSKTPLHDLPMPALQTILLQQDMLIHWPPNSCQ